MGLAILCELLLIAWEFPVTATVVGVLAVSAGVATAVTTYPGRSA